MVEAPRLVGNDRYVVHQRLGDGGFGVVYAAFDRLRSEKVALKFLRATGPDALYAFKREFRSIAELTHPNLVSLYDLMADGDRWYFTMELVEGEDFLHYVRGSRGSASLDPSGQSFANRATSPAARDHSFTPDRVGPTQPTFAQANACRVDDLYDEAWPPRSSLAPPVDSSRLARLMDALRQLGAGVLALHSAGTLHRDIKPSNVLVDHNGRVVVLDFGLATAVGPLDQSVSDGLAGTVTYMAPEIGTGQRITEAADWYAIGVMLYELLTGAPPFWGHPAKVLVAKQTLEPRHVLEVHPTAPRELADFCMNLLARDAARRPTSKEIADVLELHNLAVVRAPRRHSADASGKGETFVGREAELRVLKDAFCTMRTGFAIEVDVVGASGLGKSALVDRFLNDVREDPNVLVFRGRCYERESVPFKALDRLVDSISRHLRGLDAGAQKKLLPENAASLCELFPVLESVPAFSRAPRTRDAVASEKQRRRLGIIALRELLAAFAKAHAVVLAIDDLQWGDVDSIAVLEELFRTSDAPHVLLLFAFRADEDANSLALDALSAWHRNRVVIARKTLLLRPLDQDCSRALAQKLMPQNTSETFIDAVAREADGNPFFLCELVHYATSHPHGDADPFGEKVSLESVFRARLSGLPASARRLFEIVVTCGHPIAERPACEACALGADKSASLSLLRNLRLIRVDSRGRLEPFHDRIREIVRSELDAATAAAYHRSIAVALEASERVDPEMMVVHWHGAGDVTRASHYAMQAAEHAAQKLAFERAATYYALVLALGACDSTERSRLEESLGNAWANAGYASNAAESYMRAIEGAEARRSLDLRQKAAAQWLCSGHFDRGFEVLESVLADVGLRAPKTAKRAMAEVVWGRLRLKFRGMKYNERPESQVSAEELARIDACWNCFLSFAAIDIIKGAAFQTWLILAALDAGEPQRVARALIAEAAVRGSRGGRNSEPEVQALLAQADALCAKLNDPILESTAWLARGIALSCLGHKEEGLALCDRAAERFRALSPAFIWWIHTASSFAIEALSTLGRTRELKERLSTLLNDADRHEDIYAGSVFRTRGFMHWMAEDRVVEGRAALSEAMARWPRAGFYDPHLWQMIAECRFSLYASDAESAWNAIASKWEPLHASRLFFAQFRRIHAYSARGSAALGLAHAMQRAGDVGSPYRRLVRAVRAAAARLESEEKEWAAPQALILRAGLLALSGEHARAGEMLKDASDAFHRVGMQAHLYAVNMKRGEVIGGASGRALIEESDRALEREGVACPKRFAEALVPGFAVSG